MTTLLIFPSLPGITFPVSRTAIWDTVRNDALSGKRVRFQNRSYPTYSWDVPFNGFLRSGAAFQEWQKLQDFLNNLYGGLGLFLYTDSNDNAATAQNFGTGDNVTTTFQLVRQLPGGTFVEPVFFPNTLTQVTVGGTPTSSYVINPYGTITFNSVPAGGAVLAWTGTFYWGCRIDEDQTQFANTTAASAGGGGALFELRSLKFSSEKLQ